MREKVPHFLLAGLATMSVMTVVSVFAQEGTPLEKRGESLLRTKRQGAQESLD
jgi:hypothetical protein